MSNPRIEVEIGAKTDNLIRGVDGVILSMEELTSKAKKIKEALDKATDTNEIKKLKSELANLNGGINSLNKFGVDPLVKKTDQMSSAFAGVGKVIAGAFAADALLGFGKAILDTTAEFQKFEAVLTNTLGSNSAAKGALSLIVDFASKTPFQVNELTESFVKLANRGFVPNVKQLTQLGDLAASTGKSFDQLTEAILDAQTGEFERLKEFGIRASQNGDQVAFTFKGVTTEVEKTDTAIQNYILGLGELEGVSGGMAAISETVGGKISNLGDNFDRLKLALGSQSSGLIASVLDASNALIDGLATSLSAVNTVAEKTGQGGLKSFLNSISTVFNPVYAESIKLQAKAFEQIDKNALKAATSVDAVVDPIKELEKAQKLAAENQEKYKKSLNEYSKSWDEFNKNFGRDAQSEIDAYNEGLKRTAEIASKLDGLSVSILTKQESQKTLDDTDFSAGFIPTEEIAQLAPQLENLQAEVSPILETLGQAFSGLGNQIANSLNIGNDALKGFVGTLISNTPKIIQAVFQQVAANKKAAVANFAASKIEATGDAIVTGGKAAKALGPLGLALLPVFVGGAVALISKAFGGGGGGGGGSSVGSSVASQSFSGSGVGGLGGGNRELTGELVVRGSDLVYVLGQSNNKIAKG